MHFEPQWANMHLLPPLIVDKRGEPKMTPCLTALVKRVAELYNTGLRACHCTEEFTHRWIHPLGRWEKMAFKFLWLADLSRELACGEIFILSFYCHRSIILI
jgi:hypothetical protein